jgi:glycosyltransferase involved in cell wall biosynthesis
MSPRRVLHVLDTAEPRGAAVCRMVRDLAAGIDSARYQIHVCFLKPGVLAKSLHRSGIDSTCVDWNGAVTEPWGVARYASLLRSGNFDVIHQHTGGRLLTGMGQWLTRARIVRTLHFRASEDTGIIPSHCKLPPRDALIAVSRCIAEFSGDPRAVVVYPGIDISPFAQARRTHQGFVIGTACRLEPIKGLVHLLEAVAVLVPDFEEIRLEVAGDGSLRSLLEQESARLGICGHISFLGWQDDLPAVMTGWDAFVLPSLDEGFPIAALEAMAAALPVVASAVGGLPELLRDGETGWLVPAASPAELARRLQDLILDRRRRESMGNAGRKRVLDNFSVARMIDQTTAVYDELFAALQAGSMSAPRAIES